MTDNSTHPPVASEASTHQWHLGVRMHASVSGEPAAQNHLQSSDAGFRPINTVVSNSLPLSLDLEMLARLQILLADCCVAGTMPPVDLEARLKPVLSDPDVTRKASQLPSATDSNGIRFALTGQLIGHESARGCINCGNWPRFLWGRAMVKTIIIPGTVIQGKAIEHVLDTLGFRQALPYTVVMRKNPVTLFLALVSDLSSHLRAGSVWRHAAARLFLIGSVAIPPWLLDGLWFAITGQAPQIVPTPHPISLASLLGQLAGDAPCTSRPALPSRLDLRRDYWSFVQHQFDKESGLALWCLYRTGIEILFRASILDETERSRLIELTDHSTNKNCRIPHVEAYYEILRKGPPS